MAKKRQKDAGRMPAVQQQAGETPAVQTAPEGAAETNATGGRYAEESPNPPIPRPSSSPPVAFDANAAAWTRCRIHGERGPEVDICRPDRLVYIRSRHGILLGDWGHLILRYPDRPDELHVVSEHDFAAISYKGQPGVNVVDERVQER